MVGCRSCAFTYIRLTWFDVLAGHSSTYLVRMERFLSWRVQVPKRGSRLSHQSAPTLNSAECRRQRTQRLTLLTVSSRVMMLFVFRVMHPQPIIVPIQECCALHTGVNGQLFALALTSTLEGILRACSRGKNVKREMTSMNAESSPSRSRGDSREEASSHYAWARCDLD